MKILNLLAWISAGAGILILLLGAVQLIFHWPSLVNHLSTNFLAAMTCFMFTIMILIYMIRCDCDKK